MLKSTNLELIPFVRARSEDGDTCIKSQKKSGVDTGGAEAKQFYESLLTETCQIESDAKNQKAISSASKTRKRHSSSRSKAKTRCKEAVISINVFLKAAQEGDLDTLKTGLEQGINIDVVDNYRWTALMCASFAGHKNIVQYLLQNNADRTATNSSKQTALDLAQSRNHSKVISSLQSSSNQRQLCASEPSASKHIEPFYCNICRSDIENTTATQHNTSTLHLFNSNIKPQSSSYMIPESNKGFQLMLKTGWNKERGLGSEGQGNKYPVKTILKRDRLGLGSDIKVKKAKVTHFGPGDTKAVKRSKEQQNDRFLRSATLKKRQRSKIQAKEKEKEREFRREFYQ